MVRNYLPIWITTITVAYCVPTGVFVTKDGEVGASWGGFSASAGLGSKGGGLHAEAGTPQGHIAGAGVGGNVGGGLYSIAGAPGVGVVGTSNGASSSASSSSSSSSNASAGSSISATNHHQPHKGTIYDDIFNIPQSVLKSVTELLNNNGKIKPQVGGSIKTNSIQSSSSSSSSATATGSIGGTGNTGNTGNTKYDDIFNIPQSVLGAVNRFLNNLGHKK